MRELFSQIAAILKSNRCRNLTAVDRTIPIKLPVTDRLTTQAIGGIVDINLDVLLELDRRDVNSRRAASAAINLLSALTLLTSAIGATSGTLNVGRIDRIAHAATSAILAHLIATIGRLFRTINRDLDIRVIHHALRASGSNMAGENSR
jgi:hypothetical protein